jgi:pimeloyl-ACP methyl ester carboxylesterase
MEKAIYKALGIGINVGSLLSPQWAIHKTVKLFSLPPKPNIRIKEKVFLDTAQQKRTVRAGVKIMEYHWGNSSAPYILLSYGWGYNAGRWRHYVNQLVEAGFRVIAYDPPGHGYAPKNQVHLVLNATILAHIIEEYGKPEVMIGHSFGGASSIYTIHNLPLALQPSKFVLMAAFSYTPKVFKGYASTLGLRRTVYRGMIHHFEELAKRPLKYFDFALMAADLSHLKVLIVHSLEDEVTPFSNALRYHNFWKNSYLYAPKEGKHHLGTDKITATIIDFVTKDIVPDEAEQQLITPDVSHELLQHFEGI